MNIQFVCLIILKQIKKVFICIKHQCIYFIISDTVHASDFMHIVLNFSQNKMAILWYC